MFTSTQLNEGPYVTSPSAMFQVLYAREASQMIDTRREHGSHASPREVYRTLTGNTCASALDQPTPAEFDSPMDCLHAPPPAACNANGSRTPFPQKIYAHGTVAALVHL